MLVCHMGAVGGHGIILGGHLDVIRGHGNMLGDHRDGIAYQHVGRPYGWG